MFLCAQIGSLQMKIVQEDKVVEQKTVELMQEWERSKPVQVILLPPLPPHVVKQGRMIQLSDNLSADVS